MVGKTIHSEEIAVIIVTYNSSRWIADCIESIMKSTLIIDRIIIVDNCSVDDTLAIATKTYSGITIINNDENVGYGVGNNIGAKLCKAMNVQWIVILNPDVKVEPDTIENAIMTLLQHEDVAVVGGVELEYSSNTYGRYYEMHQYKLHNNKMLYVNGERGQCMSGAFMLLRSRAVNQYGLFDPIYHMYFEESDVLRRYRKNGLTIVLDSAVKYHHAVSASYESYDGTFMPVNKYKAYSPSEIIFRITNPFKPFVYNLLTLILYQKIRDIITYRYKQKHLLQTIRALISVDYIQCYRKWKRDRKCCNRYYADLIS